MAIAPRSSPQPLRRRLMAAVAMLHPNQAKSSGQLNFAVAYLHLDFSPLRKARAADMSQAGNAVDNTGDPQHKILGIQRRQLQRITRRSDALCGWSSAPSRATSFPATYTFRASSLSSESNTTRSARRPAAISPES